MIAEKYGVGFVKFDGDTKAHACVQVGDGNTRIFPMIWDKQNVGLKLASTVVTLPQFHIYEYDENFPPHKTEGDEVYIMFDNHKSIDAMIGSLEYIKAYML